MISYDSLFKLFLCLVITGQSCLPNPVKAWPSVDGESRNLTGVLLRYLANVLPKYQGMALEWVSYNGLTDLWPSTTTFAEYPGGFQQRLR